MRPIILHLLFSFALCLSFVDNAWSAFPVKSISQEQNVLTNKQRDHFFHFAKQGSAIPGHKDHSHTEYYGIRSLIIGYLSYCGMAGSVLIFLSGNLWIAVALLALSLVGGIFAIHWGDIGRQKNYTLKGLAILGRMLGILTVISCSALFILLIAYI